MAAVTRARAALGTWSQNGEVPRRELEERDGQPECRLEGHDVGERHPDLILPEEGDDGNREEHELDGGEGDEEARVGHGAAFRSLGSARAVPRGRHGLLVSITSGPARPEERRGLLLWSPRIALVDSIAILSVPRTVREARDDPEALE